MFHSATVCRQAKDHDGALRAFELMRQRGLHKGVTTSTWNRLIHSATASSTASTEKAFEVSGRTVVT